MNQFVDYYWSKGVVFIILLNVFGLPIIASFHRHEVSAHRAMLFRAARTLGWATVLLLPWIFKGWLSLWMYFEIPVIVIVQVTHVCTTLQRGSSALGAIFLLHGWLVVIQGAMHFVISIIAAGRFSCAKAIVSGSTFFSYAAVAMLLGAELLRSDSEQRRSSTRGAQ